MGLDVGSFGQPRLNDRLHDLHRRAAALAQHHRARFEVWQQSTRDQPRLLNPRLQGRAAEVPHPRPGIRQGLRLLESVRGVSHDITRQQF